MKYYFKEEPRLIYNEGEIFEEESGDLVYTFRNRKAAWTETYLYDFDGRELGHVQIAKSFLHTVFDVYFGDDLIDSVKDSFHLTHHELHLGKLGWHINGGFLGKTYEILDEEGEVLARLEKEKGLHVTTRCYIDIFDERNAELILLLSLTIYEYERLMAAAAAAAA